MRKMMIGVTCRSGEVYGLHSYYDFSSYFKYVQMAGGLPVMLPILDEEEAMAAAEGLDGLLITGGEDIEPSLYGQENTASAVPEIGIDMTDIYLYRAFISLNKPVLGICRGMQIINVAEGGDMVQDIPSAGRGFNVHHQFKLDPPVMDRSQPAHTARFVPGSRMHAIFGDEHGVNSFHHQAVDKVADCFTVTGVSPDGVTEAFENKLVTAVQWHPERMITDEMHKEIMRRYLKECESAAQQAL